MRKELIELAKSVVIAIIAAFLIITFVFQTVSVDGNSMNKTLQNKDRLIVEKVTYYVRSPKAGDIIVFKYPSNTTEKFIKRVIAVAGDKVKIEDDKVYVNGKVLTEPYTYYSENVVNDYRVHNMTEKVVPEGTVFVMGDNRYDSLDSRFDEVGFVSKKLIIGKAFIRIFPFNKFGKV